MKNERSFAVRGFWHLMDRLEALEPPTVPVTCPICGHSDLKERLEKRISECMFGGGRLERYVCPGCGCIFGPTKYLRLPAELATLDYALLYADYAEGDSTEQELRVFGSLAPEKGSPYPNWGCGRWSHSIGTLRAEGFDVWGYEPTAAADEPFVVRDRGQISPVFAGIYSNNVIEHMIAPVEEFAFFHRILRPGGRMAHATPCYRYAYEFSRFHVVFLTGNAPDVLARRSGFRIVGREEDGEFINHVFERV